MVGASMTFLAGTASAAPTVVVTPTPVQQGQVVYIDGTDCVNPLDPADTTREVVVSLEGNDPEPVEVAEDGSWFIAYDVTAETELGMYAVTATCNYYQGTFDYAVSGAVEVVTAVSPTVVIVPKEILVAEMSNSGPGVKATATGLGQFSAVTIGITLPDGTVQYLDPADTDASGKVEFTVFYTGPSAPLGRYTVTVTDEAGTVASATFKVVTVLTPAIELRNASTVQGGTNNVKAIGFQPGESVEVWINSDPVKVATVIADTDGAINTDFVVPASVSVGSHTVVVTGLTSGFSVSAALTVTVKAAAGSGGYTTGPNLAATGVDVPTIAGFGALMLIAGAGALVIGRRRSEATASI